VLLSVDSFIGPRKVLGPEEALEKTKKQLETLKLIDADRFATLKDAEAVLGTQSMVIDDHFVTDEAAGSPQASKTYCATGVMSPP
jgi:hypothetical protein